MFFHYVALTLIKMQGAPSHEMKKQQHEQIAIGFFFHIFLYALAALFISISPQRIGKRQETNIIGIKRYNAAEIEFVYPIEILFSIQDEKNFYKENKINLTEKFILPMK